VRFQFFTVVKIQVDVLWVMTPCSFRLDTNVSEELFADLTAILHGVTTQKTWTWILQNLVYFRLQMNVISLTGVHYLYFKIINNNWKQTQDLMYIRPTR